MADQVPPSPVVGPSFPSYAGRVLSPLVQGQVNGGWAGPAAVWELWEDRGTSRHGTGARSCQARVPAECPSGLKRVTAGLGGWDRRLNLADFPSGLCFLACHCCRSCVAFILLHSCKNVFLFLPVFPAGLGQCFPQPLWWAFPLLTSSSFHVGMNSSALLPLSSSFMGFSFLFPFDSVS